MRLKDIFLEHVGQTSDAPLMFEVERAEGIYFYAPDGKRYTDLVSGVSVCNTGHGNRAVADAVCDQVRKYMHVMVYGEVVQSPQVTFAQKLASVLPEPLSSVYFVNSGSEAIEGAMKLAKRYTGRTEIVSCQNAYHGSTHGALSIMGSEFFRSSFRPLLPDVRQIRFNNPCDLSQITNRTACVVIEPVQGEGGVQIPDRSYMQALRKRCDEVGALLIFDEIQTAFGRTGTLFGMEHSGVTSDIVCLAKALGGGMPLGAFVSSIEIMSTLKTNPVLGHITTFGGHPVCCAAGLASLNYILENRVVEGVNAKGERFRRNLEAHPLIKSMRVAGLLIAVEFGGDELCKRAVSALLERGIMTESFLFAPSAMRIGPALTITEAEIDEISVIIREVLDSL